MKRSVVALTSSLLVLAAAIAVWIAMKAQATPVGVVVPWQLQEAGSDGRSLVVRPIAGIGDCEKFVPTVNHADAKQVAITIRLVTQTCTRSGLVETTGTLVPVQLPVPLRGQTIDGAQMVKTIAVSPGVRPVYPNVVGLRTGLARAVLAGNHEIRATEQPRGGLFVRRQEPDAHTPLPGWTRTGKIEWTKRVNAGTPTAAIAG